MSTTTSGPQPRASRPRARRILTALVHPSKFAIVGVIGIFVNMAALWVFTDVMGIYYLVSAILSSQVSTLNNFLLTEFWVFRDRDVRGHVLVRYLVFNLMNMSTLLIRIPIMWVMTDVAGVWYMISNLVAIGVTFGVRYLIADNWIWAGRDQRDQATVEGAFQYDIHGLLRIRSVVALPELAAFNVGHTVEPDLDIRRRWIGGWPRLHAGTRRGSDGVIRYREHLGALSAAFDVTAPEGSGPVRLDANWLLVWSHHVLYTNMVEPLLRFLLVDRGYVLLHCAAVDTAEGAVLMSALTDTGKTSTVLRLLTQRNWGFLSDDMLIVAPDGTVIGYPKPMTLSLHTMAAVNEQRLPLADRLMLDIRSRLHSKEGRTVGHQLGRMPVPIVTINAWVQLVIPPPKYHVTTLVDCEIVDRSHLDAIILMERGEPLAERPTLEATLERLLANTDDAYTFPPFATFAPTIVIGGRDYAALRARERDLLEAAVRDAWTTRIRVTGHNWSELIPTLLANRALPGSPAAAADGEAMVEADVATPVHDTSTVSQLTAGVEAPVR